MAVYSNLFPLHNSDTICLFQKKSAPDLLTLLLV